MSEQQITVEQIKNEIRRLGYIIEITAYRNKFDEVAAMLEQFAAQQRADAVLEAAADLTAIQKAHDEQKTRIYAKLDVAKAQLAEAEKRASATARFIDDWTPKQHECDMLTDRGPCKRCDFQLAAHAALEESERRLLEVLTALFKKLPTNDITLSNYYARDELIAARECIATSGIEVK